MSSLPTTPLMSAVQRIVVALGGNAISRPDEEGTIAQQYQHSEETAESLATLIETGHALTITHGNGPQVGNIVMRSVYGTERGLYPLPLDTCVADTQGGMGYMIALCLSNALRRRRIEADVLPIITTVIVDPDDPAFAAPSKPIGQFVDAEAAERLGTRYGWTFREMAAGRWRRVVPSPVPVAIRETARIRRLTDQGAIPIACGGGGIAVRRTAEGLFEGVEAVIDKDLASAHLAAAIDADVLIIVTGVPRVALAWGKPEQRDLGEISARELRALQGGGDFPAGSMGPKVEAACLFIELAAAAGNTGARAIITDDAHALDALEGRAGTIVYNG